jgi:hypothetical protein
MTGFCYEKWGDGQYIDQGYHYIKAGTATNKFLSPGYIEQITKNYDPIMVESFIGGGWVNFTKNKVYHFFNRELHSTERVINESDNLLHVGIDFNIGGCVAVTFLIEGNNAIAVDEFVSHDTRDMVNNFVARYPGKTLLIYPDSTGKARKTNSSQSDIDIITDSGLQCLYHSTNPEVRDRINSVNGLFSHNRLMINTDKCPNYTNALESQGYTKAGDPEKWDKHPAIDDWVDSSGYFIAYKFPIRQEVTRHKVGGL